MSDGRTANGPEGVALFGATGYSGREAARLLHGHPHFRLAAVFGGSAREGVPLSSIHPSLRGLVDLPCRGLDTDGATSLDDAARRLRDEGVARTLLATPEEASIRIAPALLRAGIRVVDLSGAFRLRAASAYPEWYGFEHSAPDLLERAVYGLSEWERGAIARAALVANPGCYPTAALLAILPLRRRDLLDTSAGRHQRRVGRLRSGAAAARGPAVLRGRGFDPPVRPTAPPPPR